MAEIEFSKHIGLRYVIAGDGIPLVITTWGLRPLEGAIPLAERMGQLGYRVLLWDRPNTAGSDLEFETENLMRLWAEKLHVLMKSLHLAPAYFLGVSWGAVSALYYAYASPEDVHGLVLIGYPTNDRGIWTEILEQTFLQPALQAERHGMGSVFESPGEWNFFEWQEQFRLCPEKKQELLAMDPSRFAGTMRAWAQSMQTGRGEYVGGLSETELARVFVPKLFMTNEESDIVHSTPVAEALCRELSNAELVRMPEYYAERWDEMLLVGKTNLPAFLPMLAKRIDEFVRSREKGE